MRDGKGYVEFHDRARVDYEVPRSSLDPRYAACVTHRVACDCREAEWAEELAELKALRDAVVGAVEEVLRGHPDWCYCRGCVIARRLNLTYIIDDKAADPIGAEIHPEYWPPRHGDIWQDRDGDRWCCQLDGSLASLVDKGDDSAGEILATRGPLRLVSRPDPREVEVPDASGQHSQA